MMKLFERAWTKDSKRRALRKMDLRPVRKVLSRKKGWTTAELDEVESLYRGFLQLFIDYPGQAFSPSEKIDEFLASAHVGLAEVRR